MLFQVDCGYWELVLDLPETSGVLGKYILEMCTQGVNAGRVYRQLLSLLVEDGSMDLGAALLGRVSVSAEWLPPASKPHSQRSTRVG